MESTDVENGEYLIAYDALGNVWDITLGVEEKLKKFLFIPFTWTPVCFKLTGNNQSANLKNLLLGDMPAALQPRVDASLNEVIVVYLATKKLRIV